MLQARSSLAAYRLAYDALGRLTQSYDPATGMTSFGYDKNSNLTSQIDAAGRTTLFDYDPRDRQETVIDARGGQTNVEYDLVGNQTKLTDPAGNVTNFAYNNWNLLASETNQLGATRAYAYGDLTGDLDKLTDRNGRVTEYVHDNQHRLTTETWKDAGGNILNTITSTYDAADQLTAIDDAYSAYRYTLDGLGRATTITNAGTAGSPTVVLTTDLNGLPGYDKLSRRTSLSAAIDGTADFVNAYQWDNLSRMTQVTQTGQGVANKRADFFYNLINQFTAINRYTSLDTTQLVASSQFTYEPGTQRLTASSTAPAWPARAQRWPTTPGPTIRWAAYTPSPPSTIPTTRPATSTTRPINSSASRTSC